MARRLVLLVVLEGDRADFAATGVVACRLRERGCMGDIGAELDRRSAFLVAVFTSSSSCAGRLEGVAGVVGDGFAASPRTLRVALTTCVASAAFSRTDKPLSATAELEAEAEAGLTRFDGTLATVFARDREGFAVFGAARGMLSSAVGDSSLGSSRALSMADVAGEQVATDATALRTASA
jgi:hypothetical protein